MSENEIVGSDAEQDRGADDVEGHRVATAPAEQSGDDVEGHRMATAPTEQSGDDVEGHGHYRG